MIEIWSIIILKLFCILIETGGRAVADEYDELPEKLTRTPQPRPSGPIPAYLVEGLFEKR